MAQDRVTNNAGLNLAVAVWLAHDDYDYIDKPNYISVTTIIKPVRQIVLASRLEGEDRIHDVSDSIQARFGQALHKAIETSWLSHYKTSLARLGTPQKVIDCIRINPTDPPHEDYIDVHTEIRSFMEIGGYTLGGQLDLCIEGRLQDIKKTSVWGYQMMKGISDMKWVLQGSLYRLLNPTVVTNDKMFIQYLLLDWMKGMLKRDPNYPASALPHRTVQLMGLPETKAWLVKKLAELDYYKTQEEKDIPHCSDEDLWRTAPVFKYFSNADAPPGTKSTKNFDDLSAALMHKNEKGKGRVDRVAGKVKACNFCICAPICSQRAFLAAAGEIDD